jgi:hypothetical protein
MWIAIADTELRRLDEFFAMLLIPSYRVAGQITNSG